VAFGNANGVSFGLDGAGNMTASVAAVGGAQTGISSLMGGQNQTVGALSFSNANGVSFGIVSGANTGTLTASVAAQISTVGIYAASNTTGTSSSSYPQSSMILAGAGIISVGNSAGSIIISAPASTSFTQVGSNFSTSTIAGSTMGGALDSNGLTLSVPAWITAGGGGGGVAVAGSNTTYTSGTVVMNVQGGALTISSSTAGGGGQSVQFSVPQTSSLVGGANITVSSAGSTITIIGASVAASPLSISAGTTTTALQSLVLSNSNNVSFGLNGSTITATASFAQSVQTQASGNIPRSGFTTNATAGVLLVGTNDTAGLNLGVPAWITTAAQSSVSNVSLVVAATNNTGGGTASLSGAISFSNANNLTFYTSAGNAIVGSFSTSQSVQTQASGAIAGSGFTTTTTAGSVLVGTNNSAGLSLGVPNWLTVAAGGGIAIAASNTTFTSGTVVMSNNGGALTIGSGAQSVLFSVPQTSSMSATGIVSISTNVSTISIGVPALTVSNSAGSFTASQMLFTNANNVTWGTSAGSIVTASVAAQSVQTQASGGIAGTNTAVTGNVSVTLNTSGLSVNVANLAGTATAITGNALITLNTTGLSFNGSGLAGTNTAVTGRASITLNSSGLSFNGSNLAGVGTGTATTGNIAVTLTANSSSIALSINAGNLAGTGTSIGSTTGNYSMALNTTGLTLSVPYRTRYIWPDQELTALSAPGNASLSFVYVQVPVPVTGTRIDALLAMSHSTTAGAGTVSYVQSRYAIIYTKNASTLSSLSSGSTQTTYSYASNTAGATYLSQSALYPISVPVNFNMAPGEYIVGFNMVTAATAASVTQSLYGGNDVQSAVNYIDFAATATSTNMYGGMGVWSVATTGVLAAASLSGINQTGSALSVANLALIFRNA
jgi:hypothetical protein